MTVKTDTQHKGFALMRIRRYLRTRNPDLAGEFARNAGFSEAELGDILREYAGLGTACWMAEIDALLDE